LLFNEVVDSVRARCRRGEKRLGRVHPRVDSENSILRSLYGCVEVVWMEADDKTSGQALIRIYGEKVNEMKVVSDPFSHTHNRILVMKM
jgi:hypothetical protein